MLSLLAIPISAVPADELTIKLVHPLADIPVGRTVVDMKSPLQISTNLLDAQIKADQAALNQALADALTKGNPGQSANYRLFGTGRWPDTALGCPASGQQYTAITSLGYVIELQATDQPSSVMEYHVSGSLTRPCGLIAQSP